MFQCACEKLISKCIKNGQIEADKKDEYIYGMNIFLNVTLNILSMIIIGIILESLWECVVFCLVYKIIRKYTGGFHFESGLFCYLSSCIMYFAVVGTIKYMPFGIYEISALTVISSVIIWGMSPVEAINKPLDESEKSVFKKRARINIAIMITVYSVCIFFNKEVAQVIGISIICVMMFAVAGKIKIIAYNEKNNCE